ncbi:uncharacterized protein [Procambarus clarkii]|uniref:uncharacterized protein n=1 Tax=Procambarus clarkii TaxID=6728 RepID=UPI003744AF94
MKFIVCVLLAAAGMVSAQSARGATITHRRPSANNIQDPASFPADPSPAATFSADPSPAATFSADPTPAAAFPAGARSAAPAAGAAGGLAPTQQPNYGPSFFGPGLNNPLAVPINPLVAQQAQRIASFNPNIRVFVDIDGSVQFTDQFGREVEEILDEFGRDVTELLDVEEQQERLLNARRQELERRQQLLDLQLLQNFNTNPTTFGLNGGLGGGVGTRAGSIGGSGVGGGLAATGNRRPVYTIIV